MELFFNPRSVAVAGASAKPNLGNSVVKNLKSGFTGDIYPINPNYETIEGLACYPAIDAVPGHVDLVIVLVPATGIPAILKACARKGTRRVIIESAGFDEIGEEGRRLQEECSKIAENACIRLWGPNCMGLVDIRNDKYFSFLNSRVRAEGLLPGHISLIVQSGMLSAIFLAELARRGIGVAKACSIGNRADVDECDLLEFLENDPETKVIALYLESIPDGERFTKIVRQCEKPIVLLRGGQSRAGSAAAMSHTSSLSGNSRLSQSVLAGQGVILVDSIYQMADMANALVHIPKMNPAARVAIMTLSGGAGILACDALERVGLPISPLSDKTHGELMDIFPPWMPPSNPVDLFPAVAHRGRAQAFGGALKALLRDEALDVLVIHIVVGIGDTGMDMEKLQKIAGSREKTVVFWLMGVKEGKKRFERDARQAGLMVYSDVTDLARCLAGVVQHNKYKNREKPLFLNEIDTGFAPDQISGQIPDKMRCEMQNNGHADGVLDEFDSKLLLKQWNIPVVTEKIAADAADAQGFAERVSYPVVLKGLAPEMAHKTEHGLVKLGIIGASALEKAYEELESALDGNGRIVVQQQVAFEYELIAGFLKDPDFGPCVMFGLGGILAELEPDVAFARAPLSPEDALQLIRSLRNRRLLTGYRNMPPLDEAAAVQLLVNLSNLALACPEISQIDINPLVVSRGMPVAVDANIVMQKGA